MLAQVPPGGLSATHICVPMSQNELSSQRAFSHDSPSLARPGAVSPVQVPRQHAMPHDVGRVHVCEMHSSSIPQASPPFKVPVNSSKHSSGRVRPDWLV